MYGCTWKLSFLVTSHTEDWRQVSYDIVYIQNPKMIQMSLFYQIQEVEEDPPLWGLSSAYKNTQKIPESYKNLKEGVGQAKRGTGARMRRRITGFSRGLFTYSFRHVWLADFIRDFLFLEVKIVLPALSIQNCFLLNSISFGPNYCAFICLSIFYFLFDFFSLINGYWQYIIQLPRVWVFQRFLSYSLFHIVL